MNYRIRDFGKRVWAWWFILWTGFEDERAVRRHLECEAFRWGGKITWYGRRK
jgi:hypothetical protein